MSGHHLVVKPVVDEDVQGEAEQGSCSDLSSHAQRMSYILFRLYLLPMKVM